MFVVSFIQKYLYSPAIFKHCCLTYTTISSALYVPHDPSNNSPPSVGTSLNTLPAGISMAKKERYPPVTSYRLLVLFQAASEIISARSRTNTALSYVRKRVSPLFLFPFYLFPFAVSAVVQFLAYTITINWTRNLNTWTTIPDATSSYSVP